MRRAVEGILQAHKQEIEALRREVFNPTQPAARAFKDFCVNVPIS